MFSNELVYSYYYIIDYSSLLDLWLVILTMNNL